MSVLSPSERAIRQKLKDDFPHYAAKCLRIRTKDMRVVPFQPNKAQLYMHQRMEAQAKRTGRVRALILKGRQQGCSTYVEGRFFWKVTHRKGAYAYILTHEDPATQNLFGMADRYYEHCPLPVKPHAGTANAKELHFDILDSGYKVATAGQKQAGRSGTVQFFHGSEVAFWPNAESHLAGALQQVPDLPGTEVALESTSAGATGMFHKMCMEAQAGESDYELIFVPWFWQDEYRKDAKKFVPADEELAYARLYKLDHAQLAWRRAKIKELGGVHVFRREYPATVEEAFRAEMPGALWQRDVLDAGRRASYPEPLSLIAVGIDPSVSSKETSDECGIVMAGMGRDGHAYVLEDGSGLLPPDQWAKRAVKGLDQWQADAIVYEANQGGDLVIRTILSTRVRYVKHRTTGTWHEEPLPDERKLLPLRAVWASRGKQARAHPIAAKYADGYVHHVGHFPKLEDELCTWVPGDAESPNRLDALVWVLTWCFEGAGAGMPAVDDLSRESGWKDEGRSVEF